MRNFIITITCLTLSLTASAGIPPVSDLVHGSYADPVGDTLYPNASLDFTNFSAYSDNGILEITLDYDVNDPTEIFGGMIELNSDANPNTGFSPLYNNSVQGCSPPLDMGIDFYLSYGYDPSASQPFLDIELYDENNDFVATIPATFSLTQLQIQLPLNLIGSPSNPVHLNAFGGSFTDNADCSPDAAILASEPRGTAIAKSVPTLSKLGLMLMIGILLIIGLSFGGHKRI